MDAIDAVITWVDGADANHQMKYEKYFRGRSDFKKQYLQSNEIAFCVASILKYAPFIRKIFIVTDGQAPNLEEIKKFSPLDKVNIVDHKEIFNGVEEFLPTFNIRSIDAVLYKIEGLSENFIYFNDDMFLIKKSNPEEWFVENKAVLSGNWAKTYNAQPLKKISNMVKSALKIRPSYNAAQSKAANIAGFKREYFKSYHSGRPQVKSVIETFYDNNPSVLKKQLKYKFRDAKQYMPYSLCWHLLIREEKYMTASKSRLMEIKKIRTYSPDKLKKVLSKLDNNKEVKLLNIQDLNYASEDTNMVFKNWFYNKLTN
jgi:hypothetical protein|tara:strand:+ start:332 stop:1273 length:942 start_codon:yes stop_codon:yes gene_type:complete